MSSAATTPQSPQLGSAALSGGGSSIWLMFGTPSM
jgi:hypothetical protein